MSDGNRLRTLDREAMQIARSRWDAVSKPKGSLGMLEDLIVQIAGITGSADIDISRRVCVVFAADNGIVEERVSQSSQDLTAAVAGHIADGRGNINVMARASGCDVVCADVGILRQYMTDRPRAMVDLHVADGTRNFLHCPAMTEAEARAAFDAGITMADRIMREGYTIAAVGEMGIGNTTTSAAVAAALCGLAPHEATGRGGGLSDEDLARKQDVVARGLIKHGLLLERAGLPAAHGASRMAGNGMICLDTEPTTDGGAQMQPEIGSTADGGTQIKPGSESTADGGAQMQPEIDPTADSSAQMQPEIDPTADSSAQMQPEGDLTPDMSEADFAWKVLRCVGGLDIAAIAGFVTGCARRHIPVVLDGFITAAAALVAVRMDGRVRDCLIASHMGRENGMDAVLRELALIPIIHADLALGEGTGAVLLFPILDVAAAEYRSALTFEQMGFSTDYEADDGIRVFTKK